MARWRGVPLEPLISALVAVAEAAAIAPWLWMAAAFTGHPEARVPSPIVLALVGLLAFWSTRSFLRAGWDLGAARALSALVWLGAMLVWFAARTETWLRAPLVMIDRLLTLDGATVALLALGLAAWWRGLALGADPRPFTPDFLRFSFVRDLALIGGAGLVVWLSSTMASAAGATLAWAVPVLLVTRLLCAAAVLAEEVQASASPEVSRGRLGSGWLGAALALALAILALATLLSAFAGPHAWRWLATPLRLAIESLGTALFWILAAIAYVVFLAFTPIAWLVGRARGGEQPQPISPPALPQFPEAAERARLALPHPVLVLLEVGLGLAIAAAVLWLVLRALRRYRLRESERAIEEVHESTWSGQLVLQQLSDALRRWRPRRGRARRLDAAQLGRPPRSVREAYRYALALLAMRGLPRRADETPLEYLPRAVEAWPAVAAPLDDLTGRYLAARYGELASAEDLEAARAAWVDLRGALSADSSRG
ncbi:hypothetical protein HRbin26_00535 [bacterium HR26]|nr:hypothetical protein HRbin26_00535 [bacterium HR26]